MKRWSAWMPMQRTEPPGIMKRCMRIDLQRSKTFARSVPMFLYGRASTSSLHAHACFLHISRLARKKAYGPLCLIFRGHTSHESIATTASEHLGAQVYHLACNILYISSGDSHCQFEECVACAFVWLVPRPSAQMRIWSMNASNQQIGVFRRPRVEWDVRTANFCEILVGSR